MSTYCRWALILVISLLATACMSERTTGVLRLSTPTATAPSGSEVTRIWTPSANSVPFTPTPPVIEPTPEGVSAESLRFYPLSLHAIANANIAGNYTLAPMGNVTLGGVPFKLQQGESFTSQASSLPNNPTKALVPADVPSPKAVYLLLTGGNLWDQYAGSRIGQVTLSFASGQRHVIDLVAGQNIREWKQGQGVVRATHDPSVIEVWRDTDVNGPSSGIIDMLRIEVPSTLSADRLTYVEVADDSSTIVDSLDPAINLIGMTVDTK